MLDRNSHDENTGDDLIKVSPVGASSQGVNEGEEIPVDETLSQNIKSMNQGPKINQYQLRVTQHNKDIWQIKKS